MNKLFANTAAAALLSALGLVVAQADVGTPAAAEPGTYGRVDTSAYPQPALMDHKAVVAQATSASIRTEPQYLWVPAEQRTHWSHYCAQYAACNAPVYFVSESWYNEHVLSTE